MDQARIVGTDEIVDATDLLAWEDQQVVAADFVCPSDPCSAKLAACAWRPGQKVRPYFSARWGHAANCDVDGRIKLVDPPDRADDPEPIEVLAGYVAKLVLADSHRVQRPKPPLDPDEIPPAPEPTTPFHGQATGARLGTCRTIRALCGTFLDYPPAARAMMRISIPGVDATRYATAFQRLERFEVRRYTEQRILCAPIKFTAEVEQTAHALTVDLFCGDYSPNRMLGLIHPYRLQIDWAAWSDQRRAAVAREVAHARDEAGQRWEPGSRAGVFAFFLGRQDQRDPAVFHVDDHRCICFIAVDGEHDDVERTPWRKTPRPPQTN